MLDSASNPLEGGFEGFEKVLDVLDSLDKDLRPDRIFAKGRKRKYSRRSLWDSRHEMVVGTCVNFNLVRSQAPDASFSLYFQERERKDRFSLELRLEPFSFVRQEGHAEGRAEWFLALVRAFTQHFPVVRGMGHSWTDYRMGMDAPSGSRSKPFQYQEMYWLNVYGAQRVEELGRERVLSTPASHLEELPGEIGRAHV